jgi:tetratricopeptide (TPR) repeat protein
MRLALALLALCLVLAVPHRAAGDQSDARLADLFERLKAPASPGEARAIEAEIWRIWGENDDAEAASMLRQGSAAMTAGDLKAALAVFDAVVRRRPDFAEGWNKRATVYFLLGDFEASVADIAATLRLEPRHFGALSGLGQVELALGRRAPALKALKAALAIDPNLESVRAAVESLEQEPDDGSPT